jgi:hypothetical protein
MQSCPKVQPGAIVQPAPMVRPVRKRPSSPRTQPSFKAALAALWLTAGAAAVAAADSPAPASAAGQAATDPGAGFTVGDVLARGGSRLGAAEMKAFIPGTQWYTSIVGKPYVLTVLPDGTWRGEAGRMPQFQGSWHIDDQGRYCSRLQSRSGVAVTADEACLHYFRAGGSYFVSTASDPAAEAIPQRRLE